MEPTLFDWMSQVAKAAASNWLGIVTLAVPSGGGRVLSGGGRAKGPAAAGGALAGIWFEYG